MDLIGSRTRNQPAPPWVIFDDLFQPVRPVQRQWLHLLSDEIAPTIVDSTRPREVVWSSLWPARPDALIRFELLPAGQETDLRWSLYVEPPAPDATVTRHMSKRIGDLVFANLRYTYG